MDGPPGVKSVLQMLLIKRWVKKHTRRYNRQHFSISVSVLLFKITLLSRVQALFTPQQNGHKQRGWGHNFHGNDFAAPCQTDVGRGWLDAARFLLQSLILKLSLTQQIPLSSSASLFLSLFTSSSQTHLPLILPFNPPPPHCFIFSSVCRRV